MTKINELNSAIMERKHGETLSKVRLKHEGEVLKRARALKVALERDFILNSPLNSAFKESLHG